MESESAVFTQKGTVFVPFELSILFFRVFLMKSFKSTKEEEKTKQVTRTGWLNSDLST